MKTNTQHAVSPETPDSVWVSGNFSDLMECYQKWRLANASALNASNSLFESMGAQFGNYFGELTHERALRFWRHGIENLQELPHAQGEKWRAKKRKNWLPFFATHF